MGTERVMTSIGLFIMVYVIFGVINWIVKGSWLQIDFSFDDWFSRLVLVLTIVFFILAGLTEDKLN